MQNHIIKHLQSIQNTCNAFLDRKISLVELQQVVNGISSSLENDVPKEIRAQTFNFVEELEYIRWMYNDHEQFDQIAQKIAQLNTLLSKYVQ